ncbi:hypothetical protein APS56_04560 [Pseudalgibacter alginicilyticus]|uniref:Secretion system C-terminal sorting domain-containing protein n=1 Tax=Pseudalgibacter alginicilyticus TaxID=1736674 RepID=A0A0P0CNR6_9FLAO|nr:T9SS type A sorting domain-containing protein [Pseudalgibacter alginicilyticus]ALJ04455.1 hypothetical protein APS56_04560 [Pseudalgibacter alginicilyticus]
MKKLLLLLSVVALSVTMHSQSLSAGNISFVGFNTGGGASGDGFAFITLVDIPANEVIYFTEIGWNSFTNTWDNTTEGRVTYTAPAEGVSCGTIISIVEESAVMVVSGPGSATTTSGTFALAGGDQILAYQGTSADTLTPIFIAGIHGDAEGDLDAITQWNDSEIITGVQLSGLPMGLTNGVNCVSLTPGATEFRNHKYTGTLTGTAAELLASTNNKLNWSHDNIGPSPIPDGITPADFTLPNVTDCFTLAVGDFGFDNKVEIYPNPSSASNGIFINVLSTNNVPLKNIQILNSLGQLVEKIDLKNDFNKINISNLSVGLYFVKISNVNGNTLTKKVLIK